MRDRSVIAFVITLMVLAVAPTIGIMRMDHLQLHGAINAYHHAWEDPFFAWGTRAADGWLAVLAAVLIVFFGRWRELLLVAGATILSALVTQVLKSTLFDGVDRPVMFLQGMPGLYLVPGVEMNHHHSFPSGHSTFAFSFCFALAVLIARTGPAIALALVAALLGFSRIYLSQHFTEDVLAGAFIGTGAGALMYAWLYRSSFARRGFLVERVFPRGRKGSPARTG